VDTFVFEASDHAVWQQDNFGALVHHDRRLLQAQTLPNVNIQKINMLVC